MIQSLVQYAVFRKHPGLVILIHCIIGNVETRACAVPVPFMSGLRYRPGYTRPAPVGPFQSVFASIKSCLFLFHSRIKRSKFPSSGLTDTALRN